jgi:hypothetical protein
MEPGIDLQPARRLLFAEIGAAAALEQKEAGAQLDVLDPGVQQLGRELIAVVLPL